MVILLPEAGNLSLRVNSIDCCNKPLESPTAILRLLTSNPVMLIPGAKGLSIKSRGWNATSPSTQPNSMVPSTLRAYAHTLNSLVGNPSLTVKFLTVPVAGSRQIIPLLELIHKVWFSSVSIP